MNQPKKISITNAFLLIAVSAAILIFFIARSSTTSTISISVSPSSQLAQVSGAGSGLVGYWTLDDGSGTTTADSSGSGNTGTIIGAPTWVTGSNAKIGSGALQLNGSDQYISIQNGSSISFASGITISEWVYPTKTLLYTRQGIFESVNSGTVNLLADIQYNDSSGGTFDMFGLSGSLGPENAWYHVLATADSTGHRLYVNGSLVASDTVAFSAPTAGPWIVGRYDYGAYFGGTIDDVRVYNRGLSVGEVQTIYAQSLQLSPDTTAPSIPTGTVATPVSPTEIDLSWSASIDPTVTGQMTTGIAGYTIYRCSGSSSCTPTLLTNTSGTSYKDMSVAAGTIYNYTISAYDATSPVNTSSQSAAFGASTSVAPIVNGSTITAVSCNEADVATAENSASTGNTIIIPSGTCAWTHQLAITKSVTFQGQADMSTIIQDYGFISSSVSNWRVTQITFSSFHNYSGGAGSGIVFGIYGTNGFIIDKNQFLNYPTGQILTAGSQGVIANNLFNVGNDDDAVIYINGKDKGSEEWAMPNTFGQAGNYVYLEDNEFRCSTTSTYCAHAWMTQWGGSVTARCNLVDDQTSTQATLWQNPFDAHNYGLAQASVYGAARGAKAAEIYGNEFIPRGAYPFDSIWIRGGSARIFANVWNDLDTNFKYYSGAAIYFMEYRSIANADEQYPITTINGILACAGPQVGQCVADSAGSCLTAHEGYPGCDTIGAGQDFPNGSGVAPRQSSVPVYVWNNKDTTGKNVTVGQDNSTANEVADLQAGRDYIVNTGAPSGYSPYVYPNPLRGLPSQTSCLTDPNLSKANTGISFWDSNLNASSPPSSTPVSGGGGTPSSGGGSTSGVGGGSSSGGGGTSSGGRPSGGSNTPSSAGSLGGASLGGTTPSTLCTSSIPSSALSFTIGTTGTTVTNLQTLLLNQGYLNSKYITGYYGPITKAALAAYQIAHPSNCAGTGSTQASLTDNSNFTTASTNSFTRSLTIGSTGLDVKQLQIFLNTHGYIIANIGNGSRGNETTYFGPATRNALAKFQSVKGISPAVGYFGPLTRGVVNGIK